MKQGYSLLEIVVATLILAVAIIPISALISHDTGNSMVLANSIYAQQKARMILDTLLDQVDFDELEPGLPASLSGAAAGKFGQQLFPGNAGTAEQQLCEGTFENKGWKFQVTLQVKEIPDAQIGFSAYRNPDVFATWNDPAGQPMSLVQKSTQEESIGNPSYMQVHTPIYQHGEWALNTDSYTAADFNQAAASPCLMKSLILRVRWSNLQKSEPLSDDKAAVLWVVTHKARLKSS